KNLNHVLFTSGNRDLRPASFAFQSSVWMEIVQNAIDMGMLNEEVDAGCLVNALEGVFYYNYFEFSNNDISLDQFVARGQHGFCLIILGSCTKRYRARVMSKL